MFSLSPSNSHAYACLPCAVSLGLECDSPAVQMAMDGAPCRVAHCLQPKQAVTILAKPSPFRSLLIHLSSFFLFNNYGPLI